MQRQEAPCHQWKALQRQDDQTRTSMENAMNTSGKTQGLVASTAGKPQSSEYKKRSIAEHVLLMYA